MIFIQFYYQIKQERLGRPKYRSSSLNNLSLIRWASLLTPTALIISTGGQRLYTMSASTPSVRPHSPRGLSRPRGPGAVTLRTETCKVSLCQFEWRDKKPGKYGKLLGKCCCLSIIWWNPFFSYPMSENWRRTEIWRNWNWNSQGSLQAIWYCWTQSPPDQL